MAVKQTDWVNIALMAGGAWLLYNWWTQQQGAAAPSPNGGLLPPAGSGGTGVQVVPAPNGASGNGAGAGAGAPPPAPPATRDLSSLRASMLAAAQGDTFPKNLWRWDYYYQQVTGFPGPPIEWYTVYPGKTAKEVEQVEMGIDEWFTMAESSSADAGHPYGTPWDLLRGQFAGAATRGRMGTYAHGTYATSAQPNRIANEAGVLRGVSGMAASPDPWGQDSSASGSNWDWSTPRYMSRGRNL